MMWMNKPLVGTLLALALGSALAQTPANGKKELATKIVQLMTPATEAFAQQLALQPAVQIQQGAGAALQRLPAERRESLARDIEADLRKYAEDVGPAARARASKLAPSTMGPILEERFNEDELKQIIVLLESPLNRKFQQTFPEMQKALAEKLVAEMRPEIDAKAKALDQTVVKRLGGGAQPAGAASGPRK
jgi:uncharacterized protein